MTVSTNSLTSSRGLRRSRRTEESPRRKEPALCNALCERLALDELHNEKLLPIMFFEPMQRGDVRVIDLRKKLGLSFEPVQAFFVSGELLAKNFDGNLTPEFRIARDRPLPCHPPQWAPGSRRTRVGCGSR